MKTIRDRYIGRLNNIYDDGLSKLNVTRILGEAKFTGAKTVVVNGKEYTAKHILVAVGGTPNKLGTYVYVYIYTCVYHIDISICSYIFILYIFTYIYAYISSRRGDT
jgi:hypothetical protein